MDIRETDVLVIGSGISGLYAAHILSNKLDVTVISKEKITDSNSFLAQGGIAATLAKNDYWKDHFEDTIIAGNYHNNYKATTELVKNGPTMIKELIKLGVDFDTDSNNNLELGQEGGHHKRRIIHAGGDATGKIVINNLISTIKDKINISENEFAIDLIVNNNTCYGAITKDNKDNLILYKAKHTVLATGGIGKLYMVSSNNPSISGDGIAMAYRAGAELADLEFIQFHPTMLTNNGISLGLISEAVRGEGAKLIDNKRTYIMKNIHSLEDLAPRDIVARRIFNVIQSGKKVFLDISMVNDFKTRFPTISQTCEENNIDLNSGLLPIEPGAHFIMGGIKTNLNGETSIKSLYAIGENAHTGVHGANRLASNSLLEGVVFANKMATYILKQNHIKNSFSVPKIDNKNIILPEINAIQAIMTKNVGIIRNEQKLLEAKNWFEQYSFKECNNQILNLSREDMTKLNMLTVGWLITTSALKRTESRGGHYRSDYPDSDDKWLKTYIIRRREEDESNQAKKFIRTAIY